MSLVFSFPDAADLANDTLATKPHSTLHGDLGDTLEAYIAAFGKVTDSGLHGEPTLFDPEQSAFDDGEYVYWGFDSGYFQWANGVRTFNGDPMVEMQQFAIHVPNDPPEVPNGNRSAGAIYKVFSDDESNSIQTQLLTLNIGADGVAQSASFNLVGGSNDLGAAYFDMQLFQSQLGIIGTSGQTTPLLDLQDWDAGSIFTVIPGTTTIVGLPAQTDPLLDLQDSDANSTARIFPDTNGAELLKISTTDSFIAGTESLVLGADLPGTDGTVTIQGGGQISLSVSDTVYNSTISIGGGVGIIIGHADDAVGFYGASVVQQAHIADPALATDCPAAVAAILDALEAYGLLATS